MSSGDSISLKGSTRTITEFFEYSINSILYERGIYPSEDFTVVKKYDLPLLKTHDEELKQYIRKILIQVHKWILGKKCTKLVLCIIDKDTGDVVERWAFDILKMDYDNENGDDEDKDMASVKIDPQETQKQIRSLIRQITASVTFLPELTNEGNYTFNVLAYTDAYAKIPLNWGDSSSKEIENGENVQFKSFETEDYKVGAQVSYKQSR
ncbi:Mitotic spindle checkpoint component mad2 [Maudiozyma exigua]|uniref:Mitotic spindle checkpoint component mad2 n=1 Tax=Maudiozyma exigua TaxID=34358 RepID=A0A9P6W8Z6_MAUEX|nr:Mitotic spindle checkpoint component mad2 [Kazachstania exigua]